MSVARLMVKIKGEWVEWLRVQKQPEQRWHMESLEMMKPETKIVFEQEIKNEKD